MPLDSLLEQARLMVARAQRSYAAGLVVAQRFAGLAEGALRERLEDMPFASRNQALYQLWLLRKASSFVGIDPVSKRGRRTLTHQLRAKRSEARLWLHILRARQRDAVAQYSRTRGRFGLQLVQGGRP